MNKFLLSVLSISLVFCEEKSLPKIVDYEPSYKDAIMAISFEDTYKFFAGAQIVKKGCMLPPALFETECEKTMESILADDLKTKKVLLVDDAPVGFVSFHKATEMCVEDMQNHFKAQGLPAFAEEQLSLMFPHLKTTKEECAEYIELECLAVSKDFRRKGFARMLIKHVLETAQEIYPEIKQVRLNVNSENTEAITLYESEGFVKSEVQPAPLVALEAVQFEKEIK